MREMRSRDRRAPGDTPDATAHNYIGHAPANAWLRAGSAGRPSDSAVVGEGAAPAAAALGESERVVTRASTLFAAPANRGGESGGPDDLPAAGSPAAARSASSRSSDELERLRMRMPSMQGASWVDQGSSDVCI